METEGTYAVRNSERLADMLRQVKGVDPREVTVEHDPDGTSRIYYGTYYRKLDTKTGKLPIPGALRRDLLVIRLMTAEDGSRYFAMATKVPKPQPDVGNPAWALERVEKPYTLQIAVFEARATARFKQAAADLCADLRKKGYEAYYYHSTTSSLVTVGSFGRDAVRLSGGRMIYSQEVLDLQNKEHFAYNLTNGRKLTVHKDGKSSPVRSQLRVVPGHEPMEPKEWTSPRR